MKCPICNVDLAMTTRKEVEIDYCPQCRGIWLDRGELDKIIERSFSDVAPGIDNRSSGNYSGHDRDDDYDDDHNEAVMTMTIVTAITVITRTREIILTGENATS
jgi:Zn-finger nucleic acid-binding protein